MLTEYRVTLRYSESMVRRAVCVFMWRRLRASLAMYGLLLIGVAASWGMGSFVRGVGVAALFCLLLFFVRIWCAHWQNTVGKFRALDPPQADFTFREADLSVVSSLGSSTMPWASFAEVWEQPGFWMLFIASNAFITLPLDGMTPENVDFVRVRLAGRFRFKQI